MSEYTKQYLEYCEHMGMIPNKRDQIIFMAGYNLKGIEEREKQTEQKLQELRDRQEVSGVIK